MFKELPFRKFFKCIRVVSMIALIVSGSSWQVSGQTPSDTLKLPEFEIKSDFIIDNQGFKRTRIDSSLFMPNINSDLANIISNHSTIFIKSYGLGTLSTPSFRGTSAQHTQVEWNGINLNSPMLGQIDFSQVPVSQFDGLDIYYGAAGITKTSGAFGGVIDLVTQPNWMNSLNAMLSQQLGSFGYIGTNANLAAGTSDFQAHIKLNYRSALNNFPYTNSSGDRVDQMNASFFQAGLSQEMFWRLGKGHLISAKFWYSQDHRNLPPTTETNNPDKKETIDDKALRGVLEYKIVEKDWNQYLQWFRKRL